MMSSFLCFICHSNNNNTDTSEETRNKYKEIVGMKLCSDSHLCYICCHILNKLWMFKSACIKRSLEYPVFFSEKGCLNLQKTEIEIHVLCPENYCGNQNINIKNISYCSEDINDDQVDDYETLTDNNDYLDVNLDLKELENDTHFKPIEGESFSCGQALHSVDASDMQFNSYSAIKNEAGQDKEMNDIDLHIVPSETPKLPINSRCKQMNMEAVFNSELNSNNIKNKKHKSKKCKKFGYKKITLNIAEQKAELESRRKEKKYVEAEFKCYSCALGFLFKDSYQGHMMRHEESNGEYRCSICKLRFALPGLLRIHTAVHAERYRCGNCDIVIRGSARKTHTRVCFPHTQEESASCHLCARLFKTASGLQQHLKRFHLSKTSSRLHQCSVCGKSYNNQAAVRTHMIKHINRKFPCDQCPATFSSPYTLTQHKKKHCTDGEPEQFYCNTCETTFSTKKSLLAHKRNTLNHQFTLLECPICSRTCPNQRSLSLHIQAVHSTSKDFVCAHCPARYTNRKSLVRHMGTHSGKGKSKVAICHLCGNSFTSKTKLNRHLKEVCKKDKLEEQLASHDIFDLQMM